MSIKTLRKRIALVAVSALGAGLLSVASIAPANAVIAAGELVPSAIGTDNTYITACYVSTASGVDTAVIPLNSPGLVLNSTSGAANESVYLTLTGPGVITSLGASWTAVSQVAATAAALTGTANALDDVTIKPTATGTITATYSSTSSSAAIDVITITVVATCDNGAFSQADSLFAIINATYAVTSVAFSSASTGVSTIDMDAATVAAGEYGYVAMSLVDGYGAELSSSKPLVASVSGANCLVNLAARANAAYSEGSGTTDVAADSGNDDVLVVSQDVATVPAKCTVSATWNGISVGSKTFTFRGIPAKITVSDVTIGATSGNGYYRVSVEDAAGNPLPGITISASSTQADNAAAIAADVITSAQTNTGVQTTSTATSIGKTRALTTAGLAETTAAEKLTAYACTATGGSAKITVRALINSATATYLTSAPFAIMCSGALDTWSISLDKAQYAPGEIATLTLSGKDVKGRPVSSLTSLSGVTYAFGGMTAVTAPTNGDTFTSGAGTKTYQFSVGTSEGAFVGTFTTTGTTDDKAKTVQYKVVAPSTGAVTNAEVLAAIVKLIASINKQIRALQKSLKR